MKQARITRPSYASVQVVSKNDDRTRRTVETFTTIGHLQRYVLRTAQALHRSGYKISIRGVL